MMLINEPGMGKSHTNMNNVAINFKELEAYRSSTDLVERYINHLRQNGEVNEDEDNLSD